MDLSLDFITNYLVITVLVACLITGYILKKWIKDVDNKYIPTVCAVIGVLINVWVMGDFTPQVLLGGLASGLSATGLDQLIKTNKTSKE